MSNPPPAIPQLSAQQAFLRLSKSSFGLALAAAALVAVSLFVPFLAVHTNLPFAGQRSGALNGADAAGWTAWATLLLFLVAVAARRIAPLQPYRSLIDIAALLMAAGMLAWAWFYNPVAGQAAQLSQLAGSLGGAMRNPISFGPHLGMGLVVLGMLVLGLSRRGR
ncbi:hypothetical protein [Roseomonas sp. 18066]|uniref:hypothetical protein n=1 Tax=Roseomonas sp. 18066 TaxID=2681412 RepID=UPI0013588540|nr:hypothetical protein [Roseomonas sp. 18066]